MNGFGKEPKQDNRSKSVITEKNSAKILGGKVVAGSGSTKYAKGDIVTNNPNAPLGIGYCYQQKCGEKGVRLTADMLAKHIHESSIMQRTPVMEIKVDNQESWFAIPLGVWQSLTNEKEE